MSYVELKKRDDRRQAMKNPVTIFAFLWVCLFIFIASVSFHEIIVEGTKIV